MTDKAKALDTMLKPMGYTKEQMVGFDDGMNGISMVRYAAEPAAVFHRRCFRVFSEE